MKKYIELSEDQTVSMSDSWYELTNLDHFWIQWRFKVLKKMCSQFIKPETRILEIGCGNGLVMKQFDTVMGITIDGCDLNKAAFQDMYDVSGNVYLYDIYDVNPELIGQYDIVIMLDVIEHIDDDLYFLKTALKYLKDNGLIVIGVPALQSLYSIYDKQIGHKRRYSIKQIRKLFVEADIKLTNIKFWGFSLLPLTLSRKLLLSIISKKKTVTLGFKSPNRSFNWLMCQIMRLELFFFDNVISGNSIMAIGQKK
jgi:SAM-dependent methyltransferase